MSWAPRPNTIPQLPLYSPPGCDTLHIFVEESGAFNTRRVGSATLPYPMFERGFSGTVSFQGYAGSLFLTIMPVLPVEAVEAVPSAPPLAPPSAPLPSSKSLTTDPQPAEPEPWVAGIFGDQAIAQGVPVMAEASKDPIILAAVAGQALAGVPAVPASYAAAVPASHEALPAPVVACSAVRVSGVPASAIVSGVPASTALSSIDSRAAAVMPINLKICTYNVPQVLSQLVEQHRANNHGFLPTLKRGVDAKKDLTWLAFGFDLATKSFAPDDVLEWEGGLNPLHKDQATKLLAALQTINTAEACPQMNVIFTCFQDLRLSGAAQ